MGIYWLLLLFGGLRVRCLILDGLGFGMPADRRDSTERAGA